MGAIAGKDTAPLVFESKYGFRTFDATTLKVNNVDKAFTADANGVVRFTGWAGAMGGFTDVAVKVFDANGNELTNGWTATNTILKNRTDLASEMTKRGIEVGAGKGYELDLDLSTYLANNDSVTVHFALIAASAPVGSNDKYIYMGEFTNIKKAS